MIEEALDIMNNDTEVSEEQLRKIDENADLKEACEDIFVAQNVLAREQMEPVDVEEQLDVFLKRHHRARIRYISAAILSAAAILIVAIFILKPKQQEKTEDGVFFEAVNISNEPTITTEDGTVIPMKMVAQSNHPDRKVVVDEQKMEVEQFRLTVPVGKSLQVDLPDGSKVFMHPGSRILYPNHFVGDTRKVEFSGEAYFVIAHDADHPFVVTTKKCQTKVLGTEFDITAYEGRPEYVTLVTGKVSCRVNKDNQEVILSPGQQFVVADNQSTLKENMDTEQFTSWRDGYFYFDNVPLRDILREIGLYYNVSIISLRPWLLDCHMRFIVPRDKGLDYVVKTLNRMEKVNVSLHNNRLFVNPAKL